MNVSVKFLGASGEVTGSKYLLQIGSTRLLVDCGLFQGRKELRALNREPFAVDPATIDAVILTHAHLDHTGYLPCLCKHGFNGPVYCTTATAELMHLILMDSAGLMEEEANYARRKGYSRHNHPTPLYTTADVPLVFADIHTSEFEETISILPGIEARFYNAGHILGAAIVQVIIRGEHETKTIVFSGDIGRYNDPILLPPQEIPHADILFVESTYGDRTIKQTDRYEIIDLMNETFKRDGSLVIPAFSIGRTQTLLMYLKNVLVSKKIPPVDIVVDSPMAITATALYRKYQHYHKLRGIDLDEDESFMTLRGNLTVSRTSADSKKINNIEKDAVIIASNGMMSGGRILHHLRKRLPDPDNVILICGFQAEGSRGRLLQDGAATIKIYGEEVPVRARVFNISGLSAHADRDELLRWLSGFQAAPKETFIVHGEKQSAGALAETLVQKGWNCTVPYYLENVELFKNI